MISLGGRISANRDVTIKTKTNFGNILVWKSRKEAFNEEMSLKKSCLGWSKM